MSKEKNPEPREMGVGLARIHNNRVMVFKRIVEAMIRSLKRIS
ncbi:hypothetical protein [Leptospira weilii]|nr:hypothetical protein [Leptospira weilii]